MSQALTVKKALRDGLSGCPELTGVDITYGHPSRDPGRKWIALAEVEWTQTNWTTNRARAEEFAVTVVFDVQSKGGTSESVETEAFRLAQVFETFLDGDPSIGGLAVTSTYRPLRIRSWPTDSGYESQYEIEVTVQCRIQRP
ncbi:hypothetical protein ACQPZJ_35430 [Actinoplanes sp. CA-054009]